MEKMNEIEIPEGVESISATQHDDKIVIEFIPEERKFKRGDIIVPTANPRFIAIFDKATSPTTFDSIYHNGFSSNKRWILARFRHATEEEKQEFFDELKADGKWWNAEKLIVEDIPKFKEGDFVYEDGRIMIVKNYPDNYYALIYPKLDMKPVYNRRYAPTRPLSSLSFRCATEDEKQLLIDALKKDGKRWNAEKKCIEDITKRKFKAGDKVQIKDGISSKTHKEVSPSFNSAMDEFIGKELTVEKYSSIERVVFYEDDCRYQFAEDWLEPWSDEPKKGDLAIFWDNDDYKEYSSIRSYDRKGDSVHYGSCHYDSCGISWRNAIKFESKEQFKKVLRGEI